MTWAEASSLPRERLWVVQYKQCLIVWVNKYTEIK